MLDVQRLQLQLAGVEREIQRARGSGGGETTSLARRKAEIKLEFDQANERVLEKSGNARAENGRCGGRWLAGAPAATREFHPKPPGHCCCGPRAAGASTRGGAVAGGDRPASGPARIDRRLLAGAAWARGERPGSPRGEGGDLAVSDSKSREQGPLARPKSRSSWSERRRRFATGCASYGLQTLWAERRQGVKRRTPGVDAAVRAPWADDVPPAKGCRLSLREVQQRGSHEAQETRQADSCRGGRVGHVACVATADAWRRSSSITSTRRKSDSQMSRRGVTRSIEQARAEARKCVLLCGNCHAEVEAGVAALTIRIGLPYNEPAGRDSPG